MRSVLSRAPLALPIGLACGVCAGAVAWAIWGGAGGEQARLQADRLRLAGSGVQISHPASALGWVSPSVLHPLFALTVGPGAIAEPVIRISGIARTPSRRAALVSIGGGGPQWLAAGDTLGSVTLVDISGDQAVFETPFGRKTVGLGEGAPAAPASSQAARPQDGAPVGVHGPPPTSGPGFPQSPR